MNKKYVLIFTGVITFLSIIFIVFDWDRTLRLHMNSFDDLVNIYKLKPKTEKRTVAVLELQNGEDLNMLTLKSLIDQNLRLHDIALQTDNPKKYENESLKKFISVHKPGTEWLRETEKDTIVLHVKNGYEYPYGFIDDIVDDMREKLNFQFRRNNRK
jgi:hypothetical protein